jgi:hypothetical protein
VLATLLPVGVLAVTRASGGGTVEAQAAFMLAGGAALLVDRRHLAAVRRVRHESTLRQDLPRRSGHDLPVRVAARTAAGCAVLLALLLALTDGYVTRAATTAALGCAMAAAVWWLVSWSARGDDPAPTAGDVAAPVALLSPVSQNPSRERRRLDTCGFGVVSRGCEHRLVDAAAPRIAALPPDHRVDWWRMSEAVPVVDGTVPFTLIAPALDRHPRLLVQVGDAVTGVLDRELVAASAAMAFGGG